MFFLLIDWGWSEWWWVCDGEGSPEGGSSLSAGSSMALLSGIQPWRQTPPVSLHFNKDWNCLSQAAVFWQFLSSAKISSYVNSVAFCQEAGNAQWGVSAVNVVSLATTHTLSPQICIKHVCRCQDTRSLLQKLWGPQTDKRDAFLALGAGEVWAGHWDTQHRTEETG